MGDVTALSQEVMKTPLLSPEEDQVGNLLFHFGSVLFILYPNSFRKSGLLTLQVIRGVCWQ